MAPESENKSIRILIGILVDSLDRLRIQVLLSKQQLSGFRLFLPHLLLS